MSCFNWINPFSKFISPVEICLLINTISSLVSARISVYSSFIVGLFLGLYNISNSSSNASLSSSNILSINMASIGYTNSSYSTKYSSKSGS